MNARYLGPCRCIPGCRAHIFEVDDYGATYIVPLGDGEGAIEVCNDEFRDALQRDLDLRFAVLEDILKHAESSHE